MGNRTRDFPACASTNYATASNPSVTLINALRGKGMNTLDAKRYGKLSPSHSIPSEHA
jgi:hypothetical protein